MNLKTPLLTWLKGHRRESLYGEKNAENNTIFGLLQIVNYGQKVYT